MPQFSKVEEAQAWRRQKGLPDLGYTGTAIWAGLSPALPGIITTSAGTAPAGVITAPGGGYYGGYGPSLTGDPILDQVLSGFGLPIQPGLAQGRWAAEFGLEAQVAEWEHELAAQIAEWEHEHQSGVLALEHARIDADYARAAAEQAEAAGRREDARLARELEAQLRREEMALEREIALMENKIAEGQLALATRGYEQEVRQWESEIASNPVNVVQYELYKRGGGASSPQGVQPNVEPTSSPVQVSPAPTASPTVSGALNGFLGRGGGRPWARYHWAGRGRPGVPIRAMGEGGEALTRILVGESKDGKANPELVEVVRKGKAGLGVRVSPVKQMQAGGEVYLPEAHTDEEMQALMAGIINQPYALYNPRLGGSVGVFGAYIPRPNEMSRRQFLGLDPNQLGVLESFLKAGIDMGLGHRTAINPEDWFGQMARSWVPGLTGAGRALEYSY